MYIDNMHMFIYIAQHSATPSVHATNINLYSKFEANLSFVIQQDSSIFLIPWNIALAAVEKIYIKITNQKSLHHQ